MTKTEALRQMMAERRAARLAKQAEKQRLADQAEIDEFHRVEKRIEDQLAEMIEKYGPADTPPKQALRQLLETLRRKLTDKGLTP